MQPGGLETYEKLTDDIIEDLEEVIEDKDKGIKTVMQKIYELQKKVKVKALEKS